MNPPTSRRIHDYVVSLVRTWVPVGWGALLAWLVARQVVPADAAAGFEALGPELAALLSVLAGWTFYALVRAAEPLLGRLPGGRWVLRLLLGSPTAPTYTSPPAPPPAPHFPSWS